MTKTGTAIARSPEQLPDYPAGEAIPVEVMSVTGGGKLEVARDVRVQRAEVANRVLSLLGSLGNLALRIIEIRASSSPASVASVTPARPPAQREARPEPAARREPRAASDSRSGSRGRRQRRRQRGAG
jgi:hypothetical protein